MHILYLQMAISLLLGKKNSRSSRSCSNSDLRPGEARKEREGVCTMMMMKTLRRVRVKRRKKRMDQVQQMGRGTLWGKLTESFLGKMSLSFSLSLSLSLSPSLSLPLPLCLSPSLPLPLPPCLSPSLFLSLSLPLLS